MKKKKIISNFLFPSILIFISAMLFVSIIPSIKKYNFQKAIADISSDPALNQSTLSIVAKYENEGNNLINIKGEELIHPGSNYKLLTAAAAFHLLGSDYRFITEVYEIIEDEEKSLLIKGGGDPTLSREKLEKIAEFIPSSRAYQHIYYDSSVFSGDMYGPGWEEEWKVEHYAVPISSLQINDNLLDIFAGKNDEGRIEIETYPLDNYEPIIIDLNYVDSPSQMINPIKAYIDDNEQLHIHGDSLRGFPFISSASIRKPDYHSAQVFKQILLENEKVGKDIQVEEFNQQHEGELLYQHYSQPLDQIIFDMLKYSKNNYAETLIRALGLEINKEGSQSEGVEVLQEYLKQVGIGDNEIYTFDGSGLSKNTKASSQVFIKLFDYINKQKYSDKFWHSLPVSSVDGTLKRRFKSADLKGAVTAKTGTHQGSSSLSGKIIREKEEDILFSVHIHNHPYSIKQSASLINPIIDRIVIMLDKQF